MERRSFLKKVPLAAAAISAGNALPGIALAAGSKAKASHRPSLTVAHITDVHITDKSGAPAMFAQCLEQVLKHRPDFFLNGGDSIMDASYDHVPREQVAGLWKVWDDVIRPVRERFELHSCIGNHDTWWAAPTREDEMYGKDFVVKRLGIPHRYYSFDKSGWHFIILDGNNKGISVDDEQFSWLEKDLAGLPSGTPTLLMSHYPILGVIPIMEGGGHSDSKRLKTLFYQHKDKVRACLSGHEHLVDRAEYNGVHYFCNGAVSGYWWGKGDDKSAGPFYYEETPPGYAILRLYADGSIENTYYPMEYLQ